MSKSFFKSSFSRLPQHKSFKYNPRYYDPDKEAIQKRMLERKDRMQMERGAFFKQNKGRLVGAFTDKEERIFNNTPSRDDQFARVLLLAGMLTLACMYWLDKVNGVIAITGIMLLMIFFVKKMNRI
ncbi:MAG: hypothetical protein ACPGXL_05010 [Chitinophagales bacterium]